MQRPHCGGLYRFDGSPDPLRCAPQLHGRGSRRSVRRINPRAPRRDDPGRRGNPRPLGRPGTRLRERSPGVRRAIDSRARTRGYRSILVGSRCFAKGAHRRDRRRARRAGCRLRRKQIDLAQDLRRPSGHRHRERPPVHRAGSAQQRAAGRARAADGDQRAAQGDRPVDLRSPAGLRDAGRERGAGCARPSTPRSSGSTVRCLRAVVRQHVSADDAASSSSGILSRPDATASAARAALERRTIHIHDAQADPEYSSRGRRRSNASGPCWRSRCSGRRAARGHQSSTGTRSGRSPTTRSR